MLTKVSGGNCFLCEMVRFEMTFKPDFLSELKTKGQNCTHP
jgi:hypothetical protein